MTIAKRYAEGFLSYAKETIGFERGLEEIRRVKGLLNEHPELWHILNSPNITLTEKMSVVDTVFHAFCSEETRSLLKLLLKKGRIDNFIKIVEYARVKYSHGQEVAAVLTTSYPMDTGTIEKLKEAAEKRLGRKLHLYLNFDHELLGGACLTIENLILDGSVKRRLEDLRNKLKNAAVT